jgi:cyclophilin family peptidyl-prolyl cis-trans isomerase
MMRKLFAVFLLLVSSLVIAADTASNPKAVIETTAGNFNCTLFKDKVPGAVENFIGLAEGTKDWTNPVSHAKKHNTPLYDGTIFHRVIPEFMIQGGDPAGNGSGDPGYRLKDEFSPDLKFDRPGRLAYANSGPHTNGSQFFITEVPNPFLDPCLSESGCDRGGRRVPKGYGYTIFGQCEPVSLVRQIARMPRNGERPVNPVKITHIKIVQPGVAPPAAEKKAVPKK